MLLLLSVNEENYLIVRYMTYTPTHVFLMRARSKSSFRVIHQPSSQHPVHRFFVVCSFSSVDVDTVNSVTLDEARSAVMSQLYPSNLEVSIAGDFHAQEVLNLCLKYFDTIPKDANSEYLTEDSSNWIKPILTHVP